MDTQKYLIAVLVVFVAHSAVGYGVHDVLLSADYEGLSFVREFNDFVRRLPLLYLANLLFAMVLCFIYTRGYDPGDPFRQGRLVQHVLYMAVVEAALRAQLDPAAVVAGFRFLFPGVRTHGREIPDP